MTTLPERLLAAASGMDTAGNTITARLLREAATALQPSAGGVVETMINHTRDPHCIGCYVIRWNDGAPVAECNECRATVALLDGLAFPAQPSDARDAARYRWLRDIKRVSEGVAEGGIYIGIESREIWALCEEAADAAIDAALTAAPSAPRAGDTAQDSGQGERLN